MRSVYAHSAGDLCPVCQLSRLAPGQDYCSPRCTRVAYNFRKRTADIRSFMERLGFVFQFVDGVMLETQMPPELENFYPGCACKLYWPGNHEPIQGLNADDYWSGLAMLLGNLVVEYVRWLFRRQYAGQEVIDMFMIYLKAVVEDRGYTCQGCGRRLIKSDLTYNEEQHRCVACLYEGQPARPF